EFARRRTFHGNHSEERADRVRAFLQHVAPSRRLPPRARSLSRLRRSYTLVGRLHPGMVDCRERASVKASSGASRVTTDPAPMVAPLPTRTGATSAVFEPMKAPSSIVVA